MNERSTHIVTGLAANRFLVFHAVSGGGGFGEVVAEKNAQAAAPRRLSYLIPQKRRGALGELRSTSERQNGTVSNIRAEIKGSE